MRELIRLMEQWLPGSTAAILATPDEDIEKIEAAAGKLPGAYVRFLRTMGASTGALVIDHGNADFGSRQKWRFYKGLRAWFRDHYVYLGQDNSPDALDYFLDRSAPHGADDCMVIMMPIDPPFDPRNICQLHAGLEEMLYCEAFLQFRLPLLDHHCRLLQPRLGPDPARWPQPQSLFALAEELDFERIPPATRSALFERGDAALLVYQTPTEPVFNAILSTDTEDELYRLSTVFVDTIGLTRDPTPVF